METGLEVSRQKKAERRTRRAAWCEKRGKAFIEAQLAGPSMIGDDGARWDDLFLTTDEWKKLRCHYKPVLLSNDVSFRCG
jgi:hypothetical protein